jgi:putative acetyltransferase
VGVNLSERTQAPHRLELNNPMKESISGVMKIVHFTSKYAKKLAWLWLSPEITKYTLSTKKRTTSKRLIKKFKSTSLNTFMALENEEVIGFASIRPYEGRMNHSADFVIFVEPKYHKQGVGTKLMKRVLQRAKSKKLKRLELGVFSDNKKAIKFYTKAGFKKEGIKRKALQRKNKLYDEIIMAKLL